MADQFKSWALHAILLCIYYTKQPITSTNHVAGGVDLYARYWLKATKTQPAYVHFSRREDKLKHPILPFLGKEAVMFSKQRRVAF